VLTSVIGQKFRLTAERESLVIFGSSRSLRVLYRCNFLSKRLVILSCSDGPESFLSSQSHKPFESESSNLNFFGVESQTVESLRVIDLQARVSVESHEISHFLNYIFCAMKWRPTCHKMAADRLETGAQCCFKKFDCRLFISKFSLFAFYLSLSLSVISKSLAQGFLNRLWPYTPSAFL